MDILGFLLFGTCTILLFVLKRGLSVAPILIGITYLTVGQKIEFAGANFFYYRLLGMFAFLRCVVRGELGQVKINKLDKVLIAWAIVRITAYTILYGTFSSFVFKMGSIIDIISFYFFFRSNLTSIQDIYNAIRWWSIFLIPVACFMLYESITGYNWFGHLGGVNFMSEIRNERVRAQGPFGHPILAGSTGAAVFPLVYIQNQFPDRNKLLVILELCSCILIAVTAASSGAFLTLLFVILGFIIWNYRQYLKSIQKCVIAGLIGIAIFMEAPIWYLFAKVAKITGGTGWHRSYLLDQAFSHLNEWWLIGTTYTRHWMPYGVIYNENKCDITNHYLGEGVNGGLITMILFIYLIVLLFKTIGNTLAIIQDKKIEFIVWLIGTSLSAYAMAFMSVAFFDQSIIFVYMLFAIIPGFFDSYKLQIEELKYE